LNERDINKTCVLLPLVPKGVLRQLRVSRLQKGSLYSSRNNGYFTVINTGMGPGLTGDAVLYLKGTPCQNLLLFGSCALVKEKDGLEQGGIVSPLSCYSNESFSNLLLEGGLFKEPFFPDKILHKMLADRSGQEIKEVACATIASLKMEEDMVELFVKNGVDIVDMECSAFFSAAQHAKRKAAALLYITDVIKDKPFYGTQDPKSRLVIASSIRLAADILSRFIEIDLSGPDRGH